VTQPPPTPPVPDATVAALADFCEAMGKHQLAGLERTARSGLDSLERLLAAAQAHLTAARVLRENYDVDTDRYEYD
jgi:hypothetical protein